MNLFTHITNITEGLKIKLPWINSYDVIYPSQTTEDDDSYVAVDLYEDDASGIVNAMHVLETLRTEELVSICIIHSDKLVELYGLYKESDITEALIENFMNILVEKCYTCNEGETNKECLARYGIEVKIGQFVSNLILE
jgi:hypothetical protein